MQKLLLKCSPICSSFLSVASMKHSDEKHLGRRHLAYTSRLWSIIEGSQARNPQRLKAGSTEERLLLTC